MKKPLAITIKKENKLLITEFCSCSNMNPNSKVVIAATKDKNSIMFNLEETYGLFLSCKIKQRNNTINANRICESKLTVEEVKIKLNKVCLMIFTNPL